MQAIDSHMIGTNIDDFESSSHICVWTIIG